MVINGLPSSNSKKMDLPSSSIQSSNFHANTNASNSIVNTANNSSSNIIINPETNQSHVLRLGNSSNSLNKGSPTTELLRSFSIYHQGKSSIFTATGNTPIEKFMQSIPSSNDSPFLSDGLGTNSTPATTTSYSGSYQHTGKQHLLLSGNESEYRKKGSIFSRRKSIFLKRHVSRRSTRGSETNESYVTCEEIYDTYLDMFNDDEEKVDNEQCNNSALNVEKRKNDENDDDYEANNNTIEVTKSIIREVEIMNNDNLGNSGESEEIKIAGMRNPDSSDRRVSSRSGSIKFWMKSSFRWSHPHSSYQNHNKNLDNVKSMEIYPPLTKSPTTELVTSKENTPPRRSWFRRHHRKSSRAMGEESTEEEELERLVDVVEMNRRSHVGELHSRAAYVTD